MTFRLRSAACALAVLGGCALAVLGGCASPPEPAPSPAATPPAHEAARARLRPAPLPGVSGAGAASGATAAHAAAPAGDAVADFDRLQPGMSAAQVDALLGRPDHQGPVRGAPAAPALRMGAAGEAFEWRYAGAGKLEFAGAPADAPGRARLVRIVPDATETGRP